MPQVQRSTIKTIAKEARVTANTVSLALRDSDLVKTETKKLILQIAKKQGYIPNALAESLRSGKSRLIALIFCDVVNPLFAMKTKTLENALRLLGYQVMILNTNENPDQELAAIHTVISRKVDGVILCPCQHGRKALDVLRKNNVPCVLVGRAFNDGLEDAVIWDSVTGGYIATRYLLSQGCRQILYLSGSSKTTSSHERFRGYAQALQEAGLAVDERLQRYPAPGGIAEVLETTAPSFDGILAFNDLMAWEAACLVPKSVCIVGFDNIQSFLAVPIAISSVAADLQEEIRQLVELLIARIEHPDRPTQMIILPVWLEIR